MFPVLVTHVYENGLLAGIAQLATLSAFVHRIIESNRGTTVKAAYNRSMDFTRGSEDIQRQILDEIRRSMELLRADTSSLQRFDAEMRPSAPALNLLGAELARLGANRELLGTVGSWGDTLQPNSVLELLKEWNWAELSLR